jgi:chromosome segregation ATPase
MSRDEITDIPSFAASSDDAVTSAPRGAIPSRSRETAGMSGAATFFLALSFIAVCALSGWAWYSYQLLTELTADQSRTGKQVESLESLLTDTDETVTKSAAAMGAQLNLLDSEVRKLWDARKVANRKLAAVETSDKANATAVAALKASDGRQTTTIQALTADLSELQALSADLERVTGSARQIQRDMEGLADQVNRAALEGAALSNRVTENEEWVSSFNGFRRQVNSNVNELRDDIRTLSSQLDELAAATASSASTSAPATPAPSP